MAAAEVYWRCEWQATCQWQVATHKTRAGRRQRDQAGESEQQLPALTVLCFVVGARCSLASFGNLGQSIPPVETAVAADWTPCKLAEIKLTLERCG